jgi:hypothetical protein
VWSLLSREMHELCIIWPVKAHTPTTSRCSNCRREQPRAEFLPYVRKLNGLSSWCRGCYRIAWRNRYRVAHGIALDAPKHESRRTSAEAKRAVHAASARKRAATPSGKARAYRKVKEWRARNLEKWRVLRNNGNRKRDARKHGVEATLTAAEWRETLVIFDGRCAYCLRTTARPQQDHVIAIARGGGHTMDNVVPACGPCNGRKRDHPVWATLGF